MFNKIINLFRKNKEMDKLVGFKYIPQGVCPKELTLVVDTEEKTIQDMHFSGGCSGNHNGICALVKGMDIEEAAKKLEGIKCGARPTSCPDQLSKALREVKEFFNKENKDENV